MKRISKNNPKKVCIAVMAAMMMMSYGCGVQSDVQIQGNTSEEIQTQEVNMSAAGSAAGTAGDTASETIENTADGEHAITADGETADYSNIKVIKSGEADGDEADFYGENSAVFATNKATLNLSDIEVTTNGTHANAVFSYGEGTTVNISGSTIETTGNCSGGIMTTGGGTMNASDLTIHTTGNSSAAIRSDRGGGTVNVSGGTYSTEGSGSPAIYSTADITVSDAELSSTASQGVVVEGQNSVTLNNVTLNADNNTKNSDKSDRYQAVMIYQSMSGDADEGKAEFTMNGGTLTNSNGDIFFVNNTVAAVNLSGADIVNNGDGVFLRAEAAGWGNEGSNGGHVDLKADGQKIDGDMTVDDISTLNLYLSNGSEFTGAVTGKDSSDASGTVGDIYVELDGSSKWTLTGDSYITSLSCDEDSIVLNGYKLYVDGEEYKEGSASEGEAIVAEVQSSGRGEGQAPIEGGKGPEGRPESGEAPEGGSGKGGPGKMGTPPDGNGDLNRMGLSSNGMGTPPDGNGGPGGMGNEKFY
ncbi:MAG: hypothetical protein IJ805_08300 [Lachnospiraceae bacterium]|nr:hypothetical protein [Lachnospiraceae bacterium]